jgi:hypothetical protein
MIETVFWDLDETLIHTYLIEPSKVKTIGFTLDDDPSTYYAALNPEAHAAVDYTRSVFGAENVHVLTAATFDYAKEINRIFGFGFPEAQIVAREHLYSRNDRGLSNPNSILFDNLYVQENHKKTSLMKIASHNYCRVVGFWGRENTNLLETVKTFIEARK